MALTFSNTPVIKHITKFVGLIGLKLIGWRMDPSIPVDDKYVVTVYPHTSNWDFPIGMAYTFASGVDLRWMGKDDLFRGIAGPIMRWLGGISINRSQANAVVKDTIKAFDESEKLIIVIPPEGTRGSREFIKSGFYHIAMGAHVPVYMAYIDYKTKTVGIGEKLILTGDSDVDLQKMKAFYDTKEGLNPEDMSPLVFKRPIKPKPAE